MQILHTLHKGDRCAVVSGKYAGSFGTVKSVDRKGYRVALDTGITATFLPADLGLDGSYGVFPATNPARIPKCSS